MIRVGPAGWSYSDWEGVVYPRRKPRGFHGLEFLAGYFDCMEINSSFHAMPRREHAERWVELVQDHPNFRFLSKLNGSFTHGEELQGREHSEAISAFRSGIEPLISSGKLGSLLIQFPVSFRSTVENRGRLNRLIEAWSDQRVSLELRHRSWFDEESYGLLRSHRATLLNIDLPSAADHPPEVIPSTGELGYYRLHGRNRTQWFRQGAGRDQRYDYLYSPEEIEGVVEKTLELAAEHEDVYVITNNHFEGQAIVNGLEIQASINGGPVPAPETLVDRYPRLREISRTRGQQSLF